MRPQTLDILLIEDDPGDAVLTREALANSRLPMNLTVIDNGEAALNYLFRRPPYQEVARPQLIILDLNLPRLSGTEVLKEIKGDADLKLIPVVVLTTSTAPSDIVRSYQSGANCFVSKPLDLHEFERVVRSIKDFWATVVQIPESGGTAGK
jgi:CheY-like chemotaxis protein